MAYTKALQYWAEQNNPPTGGKPCLLAESILKLRKEVRWYLTFTDEVFQGIAVPEAEDIPESTPQLKLEPKERTLKFIGWDKILHPPWPVVAAGEIPKLTHISRLRGRSHLLSQMMPGRPLVCQPKAPSPPEPSLPPKALALVRPPTPP